MTLDEFRDSLYSKTFKEIYLYLTEIYKSDSELKHLVIGLLEEHDVKNENFVELTEKIYMYNMIMHAPDEEPEPQKPEVEVVTEVPKVMDVREENKERHDNENPFIIKRTFEINGNHYEIGITNIDKVNTKCIEVPTNNPDHPFRDEYIKSRYLSLWAVIHCIENDTYSSIGRDIRYYGHNRSILIKDFSNAKNDIVKILDITEDEIKRRKMQFYKDYYSKYFSKN